MTDKKKVLLRLESELHSKIQKWADDDLRSFNSQVEFLLRKVLRDAKK